MNASLITTAALTTGNVYASQNVTTHMAMVMMTMMEPALAEIRGIGKTLGTAAARSHLVTPRCGVTLWTNALVALPANPIQGHSGSVVNKQRQQQQ